MPPSVRLIPDQSGQGGAQTLRPDRATGAVVTVGPAPTPVATGHQRTRRTQIGEGGIQGLDSRPAVGLQCLEMAFHAEAGPVTGGMPLALHRQRLDRFERHAGLDQAENGT